MKNFSFAQTQEVLHLTPKVEVILTRDVLDSVAQICCICTAMYGAVGLGWLAYTRVSAKSEWKEPMRIGLLCATWCSASLGMNVLNKSVMTVLPEPTLVTIFQMAMASIAVGPFAMGSLLQTEWKQLKVWMIVPAFFAGMLLTSFYTFSYISLCLLTLIRTLTPLVVLPIERAVMSEEQRPTISRDLILALLVTLVGSMVYVVGIGKTSISLVGCVFAVFNMIVAVVDRIIQRRLLTNECQGMDSKVCTFFNNVMGMLPLLVVAQTTGKLGSIWDGDDRISALRSNPSFLVVLFMSGVVGIGICYISFECQRALSATSFFVMQNLSRIALIVAGVALFNDPITVTAGVGIAIALGGSFAYGKFQLDENMRVAQMKEKQKLLPK